MRDTPAGILAYFIIETLSAFGSATSDPLILIMAYDARDIAAAVEPWAAPQLN